MIACIEKPDETPVCPHCSRPIQEVWLRPLASTFGKRYIYFCAACKKVLGISQRKGFWMG